MRQDTKMPAETEEFAGAIATPASATSGGAALSIRDLGHSYGELTTIERLDLELPPHGVLGLVGPSGCGKSTLLELIAGLQEPSRGEVEVGGATGAARAARALRLHAPARSAAALAPGYRQRGAGPAQPRRQAWRGSAIAPSGSSSASAWQDSSARGPASCPAACASGSPSCAPLIAGKPVLALDEPFASLDAIMRAEMQQWLAGALDADPRTAVLVSHDVEEALYLCDSVVVLPARPARTIIRLSAPAPRAADRDESVTDPAFVTVREHAMQALREGVEVRRWLLPTLFLAILIGAWQLGPRGRPPTAQPRGLPGRLALGDRRSAVGGPLAACRERLGDPEGGADRLGCALAADSASQSYCTSPRRPDAPSTR